MIIFFYHLTICSWLLAVCLASRDFNVFYRCWGCKLSSEMMLPRRYAFYSVWICGCIWGFGAYIYRSTPVMAPIFCAHHKDPRQLLFWGSKVFMTPRCVSLVPALSIPQSINIISCERPKPIKNQVTPRNDCIVSVASIDLFSLSI